MKALARSVEKAVHIWFFKDKIDGRYFAKVVEGNLEWKRHATADESAYVLPEPTYILEELTAERVVKRTDLRMEATVLRPRASEKEPT